LIVELAIATSTAPAQWWDESDEVLSTAVAVLIERAAAMNRKG
jgi:hypothetical protein